MSKFTRNSRSNFGYKTFTPLDGGKAAYLTGRSILQQNLFTVFINSDKIGRGFTLFELLIVIMIIGILASVVLVQFPGAISKARDGRVVSSMSQLRVQARILYANEENYNNVQCIIDQNTKVCTGCNATVKVLCDDVGQNAKDLLEIYVDGDGKGYCARVQLDGSGKFFCIDGFGEEEGALHAQEYEAEPPHCRDDYNCAVSNDCRCE